MDDSNFSADAYKSLSHTLNVHYYILISHWESIRSGLFPFEAVDIGYRSYHAQLFKATYTKLEMLPLGLSPKSFHQIKYKFQLVGCEYCLSQQNFYLYLAFNQPFMMYIFCVLFCMLVQQHKYIINSRMCMYFESEPQFF